MNDDQNAGVSRRDVLEQTGVAATAIAGVGTAPAVAALGERKTTITTLAQRDEARGTERVSKRWLQQTKRATRVKEQLTNAHGNSEGIRSIGIVSADRTIGDLRAEAVSVGVTDSAHAQSIPSSVDGVPVVTEVVDNSQLTGECSDDLCVENVDNLKGGMGFETDYLNGTIGCRVQYNGSEYMLSARHMFVGTDDNAYCKSSTNTSIWDMNNETIGIAPEDFQEKDAALLQPDSHHDYIGYSDQIVYESGRVVGRVTKDGLKYLNGKKSETVHKQGNSTGYSSGYVKEIQTTEECLNAIQNIKNTVRSTPRQEKGDSGSVVYYKESQSSSDDHLYVVNLASFGIDDGTNDTKGSSASILYKDHGIWYSGEPYEGN